MIKRVQIIGHTKSAADLFLGLAREVTANTTDKALRLHDGATVGGIEMARQDVANVPPATGAADGKMTASQAGDLSTVKSDVAAHIGTASGHPDVTTSDPGFASAADKTKLDGIETAATADQSAGDIRGIGFFDVSNDGSGSGLDADLIDSFHAAKAATANTAIVRDSAGRAKVVGPAVDGDIAIKSYVDNAIISTPSFPAGTKMLFAQELAPTGWTKDTDQNNKALRIVSGSTGGDAAGSTAFTSVFGSGKTTGGKTATGTVGDTAISIAQMPSHTHVQDSETALNSSGSAVQVVGNTDAKGGTTEPRGGGATHTHSLTINSHNHTLSLDLQYVDIIKATKDA